MTENGISILGVKRRGLNRRTYKLKRSFTLCMFIRKHTVNTGGKKAEGKKAGVKRRVTVQTTLSFNFSPHYTLPAFRYTVSQ